MHHHPTDFQPSQADASLYDHYAQRLFAYVRLSVPSHQDAEDLVLDVFLAALEQDNLSWLSEKQQLAWLRRVAYHKLMDRYRRASHRPVVSLEQVLETIQLEEALTPELLLERREEIAWLASAVNRLSPLQRQVLQFHLGDGLRFADIAILLEKREEAVRKLYSRTLAQLRTLYHQQEKGVVVS